MVGGPYDLFHREADRWPTAIDPEGIARCAAGFARLDGLSRRNVSYMREFYLFYRDVPQVQRLVAQVDWTQEIVRLLDTVE